MIGPTHPGTRGPGLLAVQPGPGAPGPNPVALNQKGSKLPFAVRIVFTPRFVRLNPMSQIIIGIFDRPSQGAIAGEVGTGDLVWP